MPQENKLLTKLQKSLNNKNLEDIEILELLYYKFEDFGEIIHNYIDDTYISPSNYEPDKPYFEYLEDKDTDYLFKLLEEYIYEDKLKKISVLDSDKIMEAIFGQKLEEYTEKENSFPYLPSAGYNEPNKVQLVAGLTFQTPNGKEGKLRDYFKINKKEVDTTSGESNWINYEETLQGIQKYILTTFTESDEELAKHYSHKGVDKHSKVVSKVISTGSGGSTMYKVSEENLRYLEDIILNDISYGELQVNKIVGQLNSRLKIVPKKDSSKGLNNY